MDRTESVALNAQDRAPARNSNRRRGARRAFGDLEPVHGARASVERARHVVLCSVRALVPKALEDLCADVFARFRAAEKSVAPLTLEEIADDQKRRIYAERLMLHGDFAEHSLELEAWRQRWHLPQWAKAHAVLIMRQWMNDAPALEERSVEAAGFGFDLAPEEVVVSVRVPADGPLDARALQELRPLLLAARAEALSALTVKPPRRRGTKKSRSTPPDGSAVSDDPTTTATREEKKRSSFERNANDLVRRNVLRLSWSEISGHSTDTYGVREGVAKLAALVDWPLWKGGKGGRPRKPSNTRAR